MTNVVLLHEPEGNRNPYVPVSWSRDPLDPTNNETFEVGVQASRATDSVALEWRSDSATGSLSLENSDDVWSGRLGPFAGECHYRFVATHDSGTQTATEWFSVSITCWEQVTFSDLGSDDTHIFVCGDGVRLTLEPGNSNTIRWTIGVDSARGNPTVSAEASAEVLDWETRIDDGRVIVTRDNDRLVLSFEKADTEGQVTAWKLGWRLEADERIFGTGERFDSLDQRGKTPDIRVYEEYKRQGARTYFPVPWILSTNRYGLAIDGATRVRFDLGATDSSHASATIPSTAGAAGTWYFGAPKEILQAYATDVGLPSAMPIWAYGPWMSGNEWDNDERVREVVNRTLAEGVPATVIVIEAWSDESTFYLFNDTEHDTVPGADPVPVGSMRHGGRWPDPKQLVEWLHKQGVRVLLWQIPVLKDADEHEQHRVDVTYADDAGLCVRTTEGGTYLNRGWWFPNSRIIDFTNPDARDWWFTKRAYLLDCIGIDGFKTDGGEHLWGRDVSTHDGTTGDEAANNYPTHYLSSYHEFMRDHGHKHPMTFSRAGFTRSQSFPAHWAGDENSTWEAFRASLTAGLSASASGIAFWGWDLAGFSGDLPSAELYKRCTAMAAFSPIMQYHSEHNEHRLPLADRTPWNIAEHTDDTDVMSVYRFYARLRMNLVPYLVSLGAEATRTGVPLMRAMALEYPNDPRAVAIDDQFLLGSEILIAPVLTPGAAEREVYLPDGDWWNLWSGEPSASGWIAAPAPPHRIPVYIRGGACIPLWMPDTIELGAAVGLPDTRSGRPVLMVFPGTADHTLVDPITLRPWTTQLVLEGDILTIRATAAPTGLTAWIRGSVTSERPADLHVPLPAGDSITTIDLASHGR